MAEEHNALKYGSPLSTALSILAGGGYADVGVSRLSESLVGLIDLWSVPEAHLLYRQRDWALSPSQSAVAAEFAQVGIRNPAGSNMLVVVEELHVNTSIPGTFELRMAASTTVDATSTPNARDSRIPILTSIRTVSIAHSSAARLGVNMQRYTMLASTPTQYRVNLILAPGFDCYVGPDVVNQAVECSFLGYERVTFPGELQARG